ncbi:DNA-3-methyladenine glycosylase I [Psychroflexus planctonicus]|uniref:DNA-3-methyladenine glycosylase I n=1 Tax=Psychroflexus planctonicus TaxID=1526575 RepID=A0ABQ1SJN4_9FLAO|nr:DNA-3-methyladenine glycosylase I [Psychroflexus planctonicus]GGE40011.1 DNA-3-methyladenine glycosylase I [Psychroflexus planctonicus]
MEKNRCDWCKGNDLYIKYHDEEWGVPKTKDQELFELLVLESFQAGLSWLTILKKRENFRNAFKHFQVEEVAAFMEKDVSSLLQNEGIIRHRGKIEATINNTKAFMEIQKEHKSFSAFLWKYVNHQPIQNQFQNLADLPAQTKISQQLSKDLRKLGFKFMGPTTTYAFMQAAGLVNDHLVGCFRYKEVKELHQTFK